MRKQQREEILKVLEETYKDTKTALNYNSPFELLVAVIMSAQCTDERVNKITARIFPKYNTPEKMGALTQEELENEIRDCGLFRAKAKNLLATCHMLVQEYNSTVPDTIEKLMTLPGVGKKTANVIASIIYNVPAIAVDTHVFRVSHRLGLAKGCAPIKKRILQNNAKIKTPEVYRFGSFAIYAYFFLSVGVTLISKSLSQGKSTLNLKSSVKGYLRASSSHTSCASAETCFLELLSL